MHGRNLPPTNALHLHRIFTSNWVLARQCVAAESYVGRGRAGILADSLPENGQFKDNASAGIFAEFDATGKVSLTSRRTR